MTNTNIDIIFAEFGRVDVDTNHFRSFFPDARMVLYTDMAGSHQGFGVVHVVDGPHAKGEDRYGWRMCDYWQIQGMLNSDAQVTLAFDADVHIVSDRVVSILGLAERFGLCLPANPRKMVTIDATVGADVWNTSKEVKCCLGYAVNTAITALDKRNMKAVETAVAFCEVMRDRPMRAPAAWWEAFMSTGFQPCILPPQWCVCASDVGIGNEIMLHIGHDEVRRHYGL